MEKTNNKDIERLIIEGIEERKGKKISIIDMSEIEEAAVPEFIIAQGTSTMHVSSIADSVREYVSEKSGREPYNYDGYRQCEWIVLDYGEALVHIFLPEARAKYNLEELWGDAKITDIPDLD